MNEKLYKPQIEPSGFIKHIAILKSVVIGERFYTLTSLRQYANASVIIFNVDWDNDPEIEFKAHQYIQYELLINEQYDSRMVSGGSSSDHASFKYVISPPLPDDISGVQFRFTQYINPFTKSETGDEIIF